MDIFCEQIVPIKKTFLTYLAIAALLIAAVVISVVLFIYSGQFPILILGIVGVIYGTAKLLPLFSVEYEYIVTNGTVDIDKIIGKRERRRILSFECKDIVRTGKFTGSAVQAGPSAKTYFCGNKENAHYLVGGENKKFVLIFSPNEKTINAIKECAPRTIKRELFND